MLQNLRLPVILLSISISTILFASAAQGAMESIPLHSIGQIATEQAGAGAFAAQSSGEDFILRGELQDLVGHVTLEGLSVESVSASDGAGSFSIKPVSIERNSGFREAISRGQRVVVKDGDVLIQRRDFVEHITASGDGIRQDFVVQERPGGEGDLRILLALAGAEVRQEDDRADIVLDDSRRTLVYGKLHAVDAQGRELPASMLVQDKRTIALCVDDSRAEYPILVDPTISDKDWVSIGFDPLLGTNDIVSALVLHEGNIYIGGSFTLAGSANANYVAKWDGSRWCALGSEMNEHVLALAVDSSGNLYAGGLFTTAGEEEVNHIARWDGSEWSALGTGMDDIVKALIVDSSGNLFAGGAFTSAGGLSAKYIAKWDGSAWSPLAQGMNGNVEALAVDLSDIVYAGGGFTTAGEEVVNHVAQWDGSAWSALGTGTNGNVATLAVNDSNGLYAGGVFDSAGGVSANNIARWNGTEWSPLGSGFSDGGNSPIYSLATDDEGNVYAGGMFGDAGGVNATCIAKWDGSTWSALGLGLNGLVDDMAVDSSGNLIIGGWFSKAGELEVNYVAKWDGSDWSPIGSWLYGDVYALALDSVGNLYAGGTFEHADGSYVAKWDGSRWSPLGGGVVGYRVTSLAVDASDNVYAGGGFSTAGGVNVNCIARWDGSQWSSLGLGVGARVDSMVFDNAGNLYAGGGSQQLEA